MKKMTALVVSLSILLQPVAFAISPEEMVHQSAEYQHVIETHRDKLLSRYEGLTNEGKLKFLSRAEKRLLRKERKLEKRLERQVDVAEFVDSSEKSQEEAEVFGFESARQPETEPSQRVVKTADLLKTVRASLEVVRKEKNEVSAVAKRKDAPSRSIASNGCRMATIMALGGVLMLIAGLLGFGVLFFLAAVFLLPAFATMTEECS